MVKRARLIVFKHHGCFEKAQSEDTGAFEFDDVCMCLTRVNICLKERMPSVFSSRGISYEG